MLVLLSLALSNVAVALALAALALVVGRCLRRPAVAHALWLLVLIKLITPPLVRIDVPWPAPAPAPEPVPAAQAEEFRVPGVELVEDDVLRFDEVAAAPAPDEVPAPVPAAAGWPLGLAGLWAAGAIAWFALSGRRAWAFARLLRLGRPASETLRARVARVAERLGVPCPPVVVVPGRLSPL
ncbi:MAG: hypothetical protein ACRC33_15955, partial [Gemmataceae bacterium]